MHYKDPATSESYPGGPTGLNSQLTNISIVGGTLTINKDLTGGGFTSSDLFADNEPLEITYFIT